MDIVVKARLLVATGHYHVLDHSRKFAEYCALLGACDGISHNMYTQLEGAAADFTRRGTLT